MAEQPARDARSFAQAVLEGLRQAFGSDMAMALSRGKRYRRAHIVINPAAGSDTPVLSTLNTVFQVAQIDWSVSITRRQGDGRQQAAAAAATGVDLIAVYGGDGTVMEAASGLVGSGVPLAILPGGTANVMALELGIPTRLDLAASLIAGAANAERQVDMGLVQIGNEEMPFILRAGVGAEARMVQGATRELKDWMGPLAYLFSAMQGFIGGETTARYTITIDDTVVEIDGTSCIVGNSLAIGIGDLRLVQKSSVSDGLLDVAVLAPQDTSPLVSMLSLAAGVATYSDVPHVAAWQGRSIRVEADPPQPVVLDGEMAGETPFSAHVLPAALRMLVPTTETQSTFSRATSR